MQETTKVFISFSLLFSVIIVFLINQKIFFPAFKNIRQMTEEDDRYLIYAENMKIYIIFIMKVELIHQVMLILV